MSHHKVEKIWQDLSQNIKLEQSYFRMWRVKRCSCGPPKTHETSSGALNWGFWPFSPGHAWINNRLQPSSQVKTWVTDKSDLFLCFFFSEGFLVIVVGSNGKGCLLFTTYFPLLTWFTSTLVLHHLFLHCALTRWKAGTHKCNSTTEHFFMI